MSVLESAGEDPLVAALPPNTDYITYLTLLEYQLTPKNLSTLNRLLQEDDGTLASEIGWDLLKLVLPILRVEPKKAQECMDIIARRGNPREVIVRVSEELENLGLHDSDGEADPTESTQNIPTFAGEAPHVHLGEMTLTGMPPSEAPRPVSQHSEQHFPDATIEELKLQSLLSMLSSLHLRIKTHYPSRFLATSLPAALSAYRRLSMSTESTLAFLSTLNKLSVKTRPNLPPRIPTADLLKMSTIPESATISSAPLPDPESKSETTPPQQTMPANEQAINQRLIQAVLLEILEEYTAASSEAQPPLAARLRARYEPQSLSRDRMAELDALVKTSQAQAADSLRNQFIQVSRNLKIDFEAEALKLFEPPTEDPETEEEHEYPTSPSQIPFPATGLLLLHCAQYYTQAESAPPRAENTPSAADANTTLQLMITQYTRDARLRQSGPALDHLLSLLYAFFCIPTTKSSTSKTIDQTILLSTFTLLKDIFTSNPDPDLRDNAQHIACHLVHANFLPPARLIILKDLLKPSETSPISPGPIHPSQSGPLKALAVSWLKDEIYPTTATSGLMQSLANVEDRGLPRSTITGLTGVLFPGDEIPEPPQNTTVELSSSTKEEGDGDIGERLELFADNLPFYIASLNLLHVFVRTHAHTHDQAITFESSSTNPATDTAHAETSETRGTPSDDRLELTTLMNIISSFLTKMEGWNTYLGSRLAGDKGAEEVDGVSLADVYALEDVLGRVKGVLSERDAEGEEQ